MRAKREDRKLLVGLDIGTSKVVTIVGELSPENVLEVIGIGSNPSRGLKRGVVVNIESTVHSIQRAHCLARNLASSRYWAESSFTSA